MKFSVKALRDTVIKRYPIDSSTLSDNQKQALPKDSVVNAFTWAIADNHISFESDNPMGKWYAFAEHVQVFEDGKAIGQLVTADQFYAISPQTSLSKLTPLLEPLNIALAKYDITTPLRKAHFLAQTCHESDQYNTTEEYASGADYEWRDDLGNTQAGDGVRFKGRSLIQITGRQSYKDFGDYLGVDFISNPELLATPEYAWLGAGWFWNTRNLNELADQDRFRDVTITINGGTNGIADRLAALQRAKQVFGI